MDLKCFPAARVVLSLEQSRLLNTDTVRVCVCVHLGLSFLKSLFRVFFPLLV